MASIMATVITIHMPRNHAVASDYVCPDIHIHAIDIVQHRMGGVKRVARFRCARRLRPRSALDGVLDVT
jgi:hypothetical protein